ncbi:hypothetical protein BOX15_Mlig024704g1 [Macrostomum lignano]|uniref:PDZ domain-containing protein n=2 Tax=Macrostomum lignano TaxID=282301 RepID=A0A1I8G5Y9_9PLAT|nr:hypothetical protein BOX15_Mlig002310g2 [Macrostomum lignano]PAA55334.1 hypothetical protein BOX15_Mlig002310g1 [Macrostomum lignano]PAA62000.1 hypothetical protein BOX15_Mlig024704g1 [Macrostomum lignano]
MDLTNDYSLQPHLLSMAASSDQGQQQQSKPPQAPPPEPDAYVGMRLANSSSSSESLNAIPPNDNGNGKYNYDNEEVIYPSSSRLPSNQSQRAGSAYTCAPEFHTELTDIALDASEPTTSAAATSSSTSAATAGFEQYSAYDNDENQNCDNDFDDDSGATGGSYSGAVGGGGLLNPNVVADIANDIRDIKRAIAQQRRPLPSVKSGIGGGGSSNGGGGGRADQQQTSDPSDGVWVRMPSPQSTSSQAQQQQTHQPSSPPIPSTGLYEHSHPFYGNSGNATYSSTGYSAAPTATGASNGHSTQSAGSRPAAAAAAVAPAAAASPDSLSRSVSTTDNRFGEYDSDGDTEGLMQKQYESDRRVEIPELQADKRSFEDQRKDRGREVAVRHPDQPTVLIEGLLFRALYLGSTQLLSEGQPSKSTRMAQAQEAVGRIKAPDGEHQPCVPVDLFISTEKIMVLNTNLQEIMMDHALKTISYIADIGNVLVFMARRRFVQQSERRQTKIVCHVFETDEAQLVAQSIGQAFQVAYMEFLRANGIEDPGYQLRDMDYQDVLNQQDIIGEELALFSRSETQKEVVVPKTKGEPLGVVIVESGWGSMLPTVVLANMQPSGPAARCGQLNIGDQMLAINGVSLVGLPLATCQQHVRACKSNTAVKVRLVSCPPVVEVLIRRPDVKFQLGFSVQNGVICSLLRGGIAERGGVRVGHRIIEINGQSVVATPHDRIVAMLASGVGEIHMKTMPTSIFRLLTGQEAPHYI